VSDYADVIKESIDKICESIEASRPKHEAPQASKTTEHWLLLGKLFSYVAPTALALLVFLLASRQLTNAQANAITSSSYSVELRSIDPNGPEWHSLSVDKNQNRAVIANFEFRIKNMAQLPLSIHSATLKYTLLNHESTLRGRRLDVLMSDQGPSGGLATKNREEYEINPPHELVRHIIKADVSDTPQVGTGATYSHLEKIVLDHLNTDITGNQWIGMYEFLAVELHVYLIVAKEPKPVEVLRQVVIPLPERPDNLPTKRPYRLFSAE